MAAEEAELKRAAREALLTEIAKEAPNASPTGLLELAEAYAWVVYPNQSHGGVAAASQ